MTMTETPAGLTVAQAAKLMNVSVRRFYYSRFILRYGTPEEIAAINAGQASVSGTAKKIQARSHAKAAERDGVAIEPTVPGRLMSTEPSAAHRHRRHEGGDAKPHPLLGVEFHRGEDDILRAIEGYLRGAFEVQGPVAFEQPKPAAALHEAGHAVIHTIEGERVHSVRIKRRFDAGGRAFWGGLTVAGAAWAVDATSAPDDDLKRIRIVIAGWVAEVLYDADFRLGSSADEVIATQTMCAVLAWKLDCPSEPLYLRIVETVASDLIEHETVVRALASLLLRQHIVRRPRLDRILAVVSGRTPSPAQAGTAHDAGTS